MKIKQVKTYKLNELPESVQAEIISNWRYNDDFHAGREIVDSLRSVCKYFSLNLCDFSLGGRGDCVSIESNHYDINHEMSGGRLWVWFENNFGVKKVIDDIENLRFSGICYDHDICQSIYDFLKKPSSEYSMQDFIDDIGYNTIKTYNADMDDWYGEDSIREDIDANDYDFTEDGKIF